MSIKLPFGIQSSKLVNIASVQSGLACDCTCPSCAARLIAKKGDLVEHHFAHYNALECQGAVETALHIYAKNILEKYRRIVLPPVYLVNTNKRLFPPTEVAFEKIVLEKRINQIVPDLIVYIRDKPLLIEIAVSHFVDKTKENKIIDLGYFAIEIDVTAMLTTAYGRGVIYVDFERQLIEETTSKRWINNLKHNEVNEQIKNHSKIKTVTRAKYGTPPVIVDNCPIDKRVWKSGYKKGQSYASVDDCWTCPFGDVIREQKYRNNGTMVNEGRIREVKCSAHRDDELSDLIKKILKKGPEKQSVHPNENTNHVTPD